MEIKGDQKWKFFCCYYPLRKDKDNTIPALDFEVGVVICKNKLFDETSRTIDDLLTQIENGRRVVFRKKQTFYITP